MPPEEVRPCCSALDVDVDVSRQGTSHIPASASAYLPCPFLFRTLLLRGTVVGLRLAPLCLLACLLAYLSFRLASILVCTRLPSQLCVQCPAARARAHRSGIFRPSSVSSLAVPVGQQAGKPSKLPTSARTVVYFRSCGSKLCFPRQTRGKPCALARFRSWDQQSA